MKVDAKSVLWIWIKVRWFITSLCANQKVKISVLDWLYVKGRPGFCSLHVLMDAFFPSQSILQHLLLLPLLNFFVLFQQMFFITLFPHALGSSQHKASLHASWGITKDLCSLKQQEGFFTMQLPNQTIHSVQPDEKNKEMLKSLAPAWHNTVFVGYFLCMKLFFYCCCYQKNKEMLNHKHPAW